MRPFGCTKLHKGNKHWCSGITLDWRPFFTATTKRDSTCVVLISIMSFNVLLASLSWRLLVFSVPYFCAAFIAVRLSFSLWEREINIDRKQGQVYPDINTAYADLYRVQSKVACFWPCFTFKISNMQHAFRHSFREKITNQAPASTVQWLSIWVIIAGEVHRPWTSTSALLKMSCKKRRHFTWSRGWA